ncbi:MAG: acetamidase/formamidase family protein [Thermomicrobiales bacterium]
MQRIQRDQLSYHFSANTPPVATVRPGESITIETYDTSTGRILKAEDVPAFVAIRDPKKVNPAGGPIFVEGAESGDELVVELLDVRLGPLGFARALTGAGVIQDGIEEHGVVMVRVEGDDLIFGDKLRFSARPMVGVIGVAPAEGTVYTAHPGPIGSNLDVNAITTGATVHPPVHVPGALLAIGDLHASMGDGEVCGTGVEISGEVDVRVDLVTGSGLSRPWVETAASWITIGIGPALEDAVHDAVEALTLLLMDRFPLTRTEAFLLVSARGDVRIGQCARIPGCDATVYAVFPKSVREVSR